MSHENPLKTPAHEGPRLCPEHGEKKDAGCAQCFPLAEISKPQSESKRTDSFLRDKTYTETPGTNAEPPRKDGKVFLPGKSEEEAPFIFEKRK